MKTVHLPGRRASATPASVPEHEADDRAEPTATLNEVDHRVLQRLVVEHRPRTTSVEKSSRPEDRR